MKNSISTRASSINRALDEVGDKWCLLIIQEVFWGINTFNDMLAATGASRGVLTDRLEWLQSVGCLRKLAPEDNPRRPVYHLTKKSIDLYDNALAALNWERKYFKTPELDDVELIHGRCGKSFHPKVICSHCRSTLEYDEVSYHAGAGACVDERAIKMRRRSSSLQTGNEHGRTLYKNLVNIIGDRWTSNVIALAYHGLKRFDEFHKELPVATNILADRLKFLVNQGVFFQQAYQRSPLRYEYHLSDKGRDMYAYFITLLQWGDKWCGNEMGDPMLLTHTPCDHKLRAIVCCDQCNEPLIGAEVSTHRP